MYFIDANDEVVKIANIPQSDVGAPAPTVLSNENSLLLAYGIMEKPVDSDDFASHVALVEFERYHSFMFGSPNDEAFSGHPLAGRGLTPYAAFEIKRSSWIRQLEQMNRVHPRHDKKRYSSLKHYIFAFHDSTFECVALSCKFEVCELLEDETIVDLLSSRMFNEEHD